jgi:hypothetical protein
MNVNSDRTQRSTLSQRFEKSLAGKVLISALVTTALIIAVVWNLPESEVRRAVQPALRPLAISSGTEQVWRMYAPDPIRRTEILEIHVTMADGSDRVWSFNEGDRVLGPFHWYHWQKLKEQAIREPDIRAGFAMWVVHHLTTPDERLMRVQMIFIATDLLPPGGNGIPAPKIQTLYDRDLIGRP